MRSDMRKLIIECVRHGGGVSFKRARKGRWRERTREDDAPKREAVSMSRGSKYFCDRLSPLARYLERQVGRPWNKVWSEISALIPADGVMQIHARNHIFDFVYRDVVLVDGKPFARGWRGYRPLEEFGLYSRWPLLYVCPRTGLLRRVQKRARPRRAPEPANARLALEDGRFIECIDGVWTLITPVTRQVWDPAKKATVTVPEERKKTMSKKEIRDLVPRERR